jgi:hypothetical protein
VKAPAWAVGIEPERLSEEELSHLAGMALGLREAEGGRDEADVRQIGAWMVCLVGHIAYTEASRA